MIRKILIANRGEIAVRIIRACKEMGIESVAVYSKADENSLHKKLANEAICIGEGQASDSYLNMERIISAACLTGCDAIHPGFGFLSENSHFAEMVNKCGMIFIGPSPMVMDKMGNKSNAIKMMLEAGVSVVPGSHKAVEDLEEARLIAKRIGYPVLIKASAGGGGKGIRIVNCDEEMPHLFNEARDEAIKFFASDEIYIEKYILNPKHIEVQVICDKLGHAVHLFERDCSAQRRKQKLLEESPCQGISQELRERLYADAIKACKKVNYDSVGTIEFIVDKQENHYFIEMNTRVQVEHPVSEMVTGMDIIKNMIRIADNNPLPFTQDDIKIYGHAMECRINAEDMDNDFRPCPGTINFLHIPGGKGVRIDSGIYSGYKIPPYYDSMLLKLIVFAPTRLECIRKMRAALEELIVSGVKTTTEFHYMLLHHPQFIMGSYDTGFIEDFLKELNKNGRSV